MAPKISYPRACDLCGGSYGNRSSFSNHQQLKDSAGASVCSRRQNTSSTTNHSGSGDNNVNIYNQCHFNLPDWLNLTELKDAFKDINAIKIVLEQLQNRGVETEKDVCNYIKKNAFALTDYTHALAENRWNTTKLESLADTVIYITKHMTPGKKARITPLRIMYNKVFVSSSPDHNTPFEEVHRRPFYMPEKAMKCDVLCYDDEKDPFSGMGWQKKQWRSLLSDLLFMLGNKLFHTMQKDVVMNQLNEPHCFRTWWSTIGGSELLLMDDDVTEMMDCISDELIKDCQNDVIIGWNRLITYCNLLHQTADAEQIPYLKELETKRKDLGERRCSLDQQDIDSDEEEEHDQKKRALDAQHSEVCKAIKKEKKRLGVVRKCNHVLI